ncbi:MAG: hypothetical protein ABI541_03285, partial [Betaproteobacteria bacterium]
SDSVPARPATGILTLRVMLGIRVEQPADHALILGMMLRRFLLEELNAAFAQGERHLDAFFAKHEILGRRQEIRNHP